MKKCKMLLSIFMSCIILLLSVVPVLGETIITINPTVISEDLKAVMETSSDNDKILVHVWYYDINQDMIEKSVEQTCGLTKENIKVDYEMPSMDLILACKNGDANAKIEMDNYLKRTEKPRLKERERTEEYVQTRRELSKTEYTQKSNGIINDFNISEDKILFKSEYVPTFIAELNKNEIELLASDSRIESIEHYIPYECSDAEVSNDLSTDNIVTLEKEVSGITKINEVFGLTGEGVKIGMIESSCPDVTNDTIDDANIVIRDNSIIKEHSINVARIIVGDTDGIAKDATLYSVRNPDNYFGNRTFEFAQIEWLIEQGVSVINMSYGMTPWYSVEEYTYSFPEKWIDHLVSHHNITVVVAAGNNGEQQARVASPALAHNVITVGAYSNNFTTDTMDDFMEAYSSYNESGQYSQFYYATIEKPDVIMPGNITLLEYYGYTIEDILYERDVNEKNCFDGGTSFAAPFLTGSIALMFQLKPSLSTLPQAVKAIVLASCHRKVKPSYRNEPAETLNAGITERQGAGVPDVWTMACIVCQGTYGFGVLGGTDTKINIVQPPYGAEYMNVSVAWLRENYLENEITENTTSEDVVVGDDSNIDLSIYKTDGILGTSLLEHSSTEMCYVELSAPDFKYQIRLTQNSNPNNVRYGYAWSTDNMYAPININEDGIYYIKNAASNRYITYDTSSAIPKAIHKSIVNQSEFSDANQWIIRSDNDMHKISPGYGTTELYFGQSDTLSGTSYTSQLNSVAQDISILYNEDGTVSFINSTGDRILSYSGSSLLWNTYNNVSNKPTQKQKWYLEKVNYLCGDVNMDGALETGGTTEVDGETITLPGLDQIFVQNYLTGSVSMNNLQLFLADINKDGEVTILDANFINQFAKYKYF